MLCASCGSRQCRTKSNTAEQNLQKFYNFCATLLILSMTANSAHAKLQNSDITTEGILFSGHPWSYIGSFTKRLRQVLQTDMLGAVGDSSEMIRFWGQKVKVKKGPKMVKKGILKVMHSNVMVRTTIN